MTTTNVLEHIKQLEETERLTLGLLLIKNSMQFSPFQATSFHFNPANVSVSYSIRPSSNLAGTGGRTGIRLHPALARPENKRHCIETIFHELVHVIDFSVRGRTDHSAQWAWLFNCFGFHPTRTHSLNLKHGHLEELEL